MQATGILLIFTAVLNLFASIPYLALGGLTSFMSEIETVQFEPNGENGDIIKHSEESQANLQKHSVLPITLGLFLLISVVVLITAAIFFYKNKHPIFIMVAGVIAFGGEVFCFVVSHFGVMNIIGLVAGVLAIISGIEMRKAYNLS